MPARSTGGATGRRQRAKPSAAGAGPGRATTGKTAAKKPKPKATPKPRAKKPAGKATVVSVFGPFGSRVLVEMDVEQAGKVFAEIGDPMAPPTHVIDAVRGELDEIEKRKRGLGSSQLAATATALAYELENPYNSATSKSMCARALNETMGMLRELAPAKPEDDRIDHLERKRSERRAAVRRSTGA
jgi:hypothetical protein